MPRKPIVGGNWKCNPASLKDATKLLDAWKGKAFDKSQIDVVICPTAIHLPFVKEGLESMGMMVASQTVSATGMGAFTGEHTADHLVDMGIGWTLVGHSERRMKYGETDEVTAAKVARCQEKGVGAILCIGELLEERESGTTDQVNRRQLAAVIPKITNWDLIVIAYEPVWAIGTGKVATPDQAQETHAAIRSYLRGAVSAEVAERVRIQYGGSVTPDNCGELIGKADIDGFLVGGASLKPSFTEIISTTSKTSGASTAGLPTGASARGGLPSTLPDAVLKELNETATKLCAPGKGFLAADESAGPWLRAGHAGAKQIPDTLENRAAYRSLCFSTPGLSEHISGVILHWETLFQKDASGKAMVDIITGNGMVPGIKVDKAYNKKGMWGTKVGPLGHPEVATLGLDDLQQRAAEAYKQGARFAKWRNVVQLDPAKCLPSDAAISDTVHTLARYASICQSEGLVPIVEPEIVPNGAHDIAYCAKVTEKVLAAQFKALALHHVYLEGAVLKPNMVKNGLSGPRVDSETVANYTVQALLRTVPDAMPGIFFLSGETANDEDNEETATVNLMTMHKLYPKLPWHLSFSYGKALQKTCIVTWMGKEENKGAAQAALKARSKANSEAVFGTYVPGSCASVGTAGNVEQAAGPY